MSVPPTSRPLPSSATRSTPRAGPSSATATAPASPKVQSAPLRQRQFVFLLLNQFTFLSFAAAIEPLRIANRMSGQPLYRWTLMAENGTAT